MSDKVKFCKNCRENMIPVFYGYYPINLYECPRCKTPIPAINMSLDDYFVIHHTSKDVNFIESMIKLHDEDIIAYEEKMSTFRANDPWWQEKTNPKPKVEESNAPKCPKCGSTHITTGARGVSGFWGFIGAGKTVNRCSNCGNTWKPRG